MSSTLLSLPTELLLAIIDAIQDQKSLLNLVLTCRLARLLAEPILYRSMVITAGSQAKCLADALSSQQRFNFVESLDLFPEYHKETDIEALTPTIGTMTHLRGLSMESSFANYQRWRYTSRRWRDLLQGYRLLFSEAARGIGLQNLETLTIHWAGNENRFWRLTDISSIFKLPALQRLTLSCAALLDDLAAHLTDLPAGTTPLTNLHLIECFVTPKAISAVLALPRALRSCHLGNLRHQEFHYPDEDHTEALAESYLHALCQQRQSLENLVWTDAREDDDEEDDGHDTDFHHNGDRSLSDFTQLRNLTLDGPCTTFFSILLSKHAAPRHVERLRLVRYAFTSSQIPSIPPASEFCRYLPALRNLDVILSNNENPTPEFHPHWSVEDFRETLQRLGGDFRFAGQGVEVVVSMETRGDRFISPYLFAEEVPRERVVYRCGEEGEVFDIPA
ncbi:hypothetical protein FB45DRAFT_895299 [Roridomyces roridus]|uniref:F-box domain-containing protein n=1 Tax=Roridomyces roridus TaxID=1738132 RepID=A0AAD7B4M5_9AGAR|nr:hypothetical protein FB45DRAFT_942614 [Roridomyces roridus]KAJ7648136.1 hypothetical protein FB45DRAFT_895299 [Roridomyces roridus]